MSILLTAFPSGWERHPEDDGLVFVEAGHMDIFHAAANDPSCRAAILAVEEAEKARDREAFRNAWKTSTHQKPHEVALKHHPKTSISFSNHVKHEGDILGLGFDIEKVRTPLETMISFYRQHQKPRFDTTYIEIINGWRTTQGNLEDKKEPHDHGHPVLNRIFCSGGTVLPLTSAGEIQVPEGDFLFLKSECPHQPEKQTLQNQGQDRFTVAVYGY